MTTYLVGGREISTDEARLYAEARLGRPLTDGERALDLVGLDVDLAEGKARLEAAIEEEKRRALESRLDGGSPALSITPEMEEVVASIVEAGRRHAREEIERLVGRGFEEDVREFQEGGWLDRLLGNLIRYLTAIRVRVNAEAGAAEFEGASRITEELIDRLDERIPGSRDAASRLVSGLFIGGLGEVYEENAHLFPCFTYSAVMDGATCEVCRRFDGTRYETWAEGETHLPGGGPNPLCLGDGRCRCRLVPCAPGERVDDVAAEPEPDLSPMGTLRSDAQSFAGFSDEEFVALESGENAGQDVYNIAGGPNRSIQGRVDELRDIGRRIEDEANRRYRDEGHERKSEEAIEAEEENRERIRQMFDDRTKLYETIEREILDEFPDDDPDTRDRMIRRDERYVALKERIERAQAEQLRLLRENERRYDPLRVMADLRRQILSEIRDFGGTFDRRERSFSGGQRNLWAKEGYRNVNDPHWYEVADEQAAFLPSQWIERSNNRGGFNVSDRRRGHYSDGVPMVATSGSSPEDLSSTMLHELGHRMEYSVPELRMWAWSFNWMRQEASHRNGTWRREKLAVLRPGLSYESHEVAEPDDYVNPYTGRDYGSDPLSSTEILTMGLQGVFHGDPIDDDHRDFVLGLLAAVRFGA